MYERLETYYEMIESMEAGIEKAASPMHDAKAFVEKLAMYKLDLTAQYVRLLETKGAYMQ